MLQISKRVFIPDPEIVITTARSGGPGGQHVNTSSTAIHLRFDIKNSSLPEMYKERLLKLKDKRISKEGVIIIKAQEYKSQGKNREMALERLRLIIRSVFVTRKKRIPTQPTRSSRIKRLNNKTRRGDLKKLRGKTGLED